VGGHVTHRVSTFQLPYRDQALEWPEIRSFGFYNQNMLLTMGFYSSGQYLLVLINRELNQANYSAEKIRLKDSISWLLNS
jgi:hypothetical protein